MKLLFISLDYVYIDNIFVFDYVQKVFLKLFYKLVYYDYLPLRFVRGCRVVRLSCTRLYNYFSSSS